MPPLKQPVEFNVRPRLPVAGGPLRREESGSRTGIAGANVTLIDALLQEQRSLTAVDRFARRHESLRGQPGERSYRELIPLTSPKPGEQFAFEVDLDKCSGCKACVTACHSLNGLEENETWRSVGLLISPGTTDVTARTAHHASRLQHVTTACHHCADPGCANGCPVLAYDKDPVTGIVRHLDDQCMGCSYCVMKCPYEVPKYSTRLGIVRKCDMCYQRLAVGEAPACVQACPDEAIRITLVKRPAMDDRSRSAPDKFLPDAPPPSLTLPTTRYLSVRPLAHLFAADHAALRLEQPHWPLVVMLVLTQAAAGMFLTAALGRFGGLTTGLGALMWVGFGALGLGLIASVLHLGQPLKAWRAFLGWRKSWLSREIIALNAFAVTALAACCAIASPWSTLLAALLGLCGVCASAMVYVDTHRPFWASRITFGNFFGTTLLLGATGAAVVLAACAAPRSSLQTAALAALLLRTALFVWRRLELRHALNDPASPIHFNARVIQQRLPKAVARRTALFVFSTGFGLLALADVADRALLWASLAALSTFACELLARYVFFAASAAKRMPGGVAA